MSTYLSSVKTSYCLHYRETRLPLKKGFGDKAVGGVLGILSIRSSCKATAVQSPSRLSWGSLYPLPPLCGGAQQTLEWWHGVAVTVGLLFSIFLQPFLRQSLIKQKTRCFLCASMLQYCKYILCAHKNI